MSTIYINGLGYRNSITEKEQIIWYFEQMAASKSKSFATRYWLDLKETYTNALLKFQAYELLEYINSKSSKEQDMRRALSRIKAKEKQEKELEHWQEWREKRVVTKELTEKIGLN